MPLNCEVTLYKAPGSIIRELGGSPHVGAVIIDRKSSWPSGTKQKEKSDKMKNLQKNKKETYPRMHCPVPRRGCAADWRELCLCPLSTFNFLFDFILEAALIDLLNPP